MVESVDTPWKLTVALIALIVLLTAREVLQWLSRRREAREPDAVRVTLDRLVEITLALQDRIGSVSREIHDLHEWHDVDDGDGRKIWYAGRQTEKRLEQLRDSVESLKRAVESLLAIIQSWRRDGNGRD